MRQLSIYGQQEERKAAQEIQQQKDAAQEKKNLIAAQEAMTRTNAWMNENPGKSTSEGMNFFVGTMKELGGTPNASANKLMAILAANKLKKDEMEATKQHRLDVRAEKSIFQQQQLESGIEQKELDRASKERIADKQAGGIDRKVTPQDPSKHINIFSNVVKRLGVDDAELLKEAANEMAKVDPKNPRLAWQKALGIVTGKIKLPPKVIEEAIAEETKAYGS